MNRGHRPFSFALLLAGSISFSFLVLLTPQSWAQNSDGKPDIRFGVAMTGPGGLYAYAPNRWGLLHVNATNRRDEASEIISATYFNDEPTLQYGRKIWLPPRSRMLSWHPVRIPEKMSGDGKKIHFHSLLMDANSPREVLIRTESGQMQHDGFLQVTREPITGVIDNLDGSKSTRTNESVELISICRSFQALSRSVSSMTDSVFTPGEESFDALDQLVICDSRPMHDAAGLAAIRHWLFSGGHLWVMLDQTDPVVLEMLLGDEIQCEVVDRVTLNQIHIEPGPAGPQATRSQQEFEKPVEMVRTLVSNVDVAYTVNDWPAAFWKNCGEGRLLVTTLGARGWTQPRDEQRKVNRGRDEKTAAPSAEAPLIPINRSFGVQSPTDPLGNLCSEFWEKRKAASLEPQTLEATSQEYVGYAIPSRTAIVGLLAGFCGMLVLSGLFLWRMGRLEWLGAIGPGLALASSVALVGLGQAQRHSIPPTTASIQFVQTIPGTDDYVAQGQIGVFTPEPGEANYGVTSGGWIMPEMTGLESTSRRLIWTDLGHSEWRNVPSTAGSRSASFHTSGELAQRVTATAVFGPQGLTGTLNSGKAVGASDALIASDNGRQGVTLNGDGTFSSPTSGVFTKEQFLSAELVSDEQNRRRQTLKQLLTNPKRLDEPSRPTLYFWTEPWDLGFKLVPDARQLGSTLVAVPLELQRPATGTEVSISSPLLQFKAIKGPDGNQPSGLWDQLHHEWADKAVPSATWLRYQVPLVLLPLKLTGGRIQVQVVGPVGKLELSTGQYEIPGVQQRRITPLQKWIDPVGTVTFELPATDVLAVDDQGGFYLRIAGGDPERPELTKTETADGAKTNYWRFESVTLELKGKTIDPQTAGK